jgi:hypothetical protein
MSWHHRSNWTVGPARVLKYPAASDTIAIPSERIQQRVDDSCSYTRTRCVPLRSRASTRSLFVLRLSLGPSRLGGIQDHQSIDPGPVRVLYRSSKQFHSDRIKIQDRCILPSVRERHPRPHVNHQSSISLAITRGPESVKPM